MASRRRRPLDRPGDRVQLVGGQQPQLMVPQQPQQPPIINTGGQAFTQTGFGPGNTLRNQQINPTASPFQQGVDQLTGQLAGQVAGQQLGPFRGVSPNLFGGGGQANALTDEALGSIRGATGIQNRGSVAAGTFSPSAGAQQARQAAMRALGGLEGPDRLELLQRALNRRSEERAPLLEQQLRGVGQRAAALGRLGAGLTTNELTDVFTREQDAERRFTEALTDQALGQTLQDRLGVLSGTLGAGSLFGQQDLANASFQQGLRNEQRNELSRLGQIDAFNSQLGLQRAGALGGLASDVFGRGAALRGELRGERDAATGHQLANFGLQSGALSQLGGLGQNLFNRGVTQRNELRGERDFQDRLATGALDRNIQQRLLEQQFGQQDFANQLAIAQAMGQFGIPFGGADPSNVLLNSTAAIPQGSGAGDFLQLMALRRAQQQGALGPAQGGIPFTGIDPNSEFA